MQKRLAEYLALKCFRNSVLEDFHTGIVPASKSGDYTDVFVSTPFGEIPWNGLSRFDDADMKALMVDVVNKTYLLVQELFDEQHGGELLLKLAARNPAPHRADPNSADLGGSIPQQSNAASASRRSSRPGKTLPPPRTHRPSSFAAESQSR